MGLGIQNGALDAEHEQNKNVRFFLQNSTDPTDIETGFRISLTWYRGGWVEENRMPKCALICQFMRPLGALVRAFLPVSHHPCARAQGCLCSDFAVVHAALAGADHSLDAGSWIWYQNCKYAKYLRIFEV